MKTLHKYAVMVVGAFFSLFSAATFAAVPADVTTAITTAVTDVGTVGAAVIVVFVAVKAWKWLRGAL